MAVLPSLIFPHLPHLLWSLPILLALSILFTWTSTHIRYRLALRHFRPDSRDKTTPRRPPHIPYTYPILGHALDFLNRIPGACWRTLAAPADDRLLRHPGISTILLGGQRMHVLASPAAVQQLFRTRPASRTVLNLQVVQQGFGLSAAEARHYYGLGEPGSDAERREERIWHEFLVKADAVNELTAEFVAQFEGELAKGGPSDGADAEVPLNAWLRRRMFDASTRAFFGSRLAEMYPGGDLAGDFFAFDAEMLDLLYGLPRWVAPRAHAARRRLLDGMEAWQRAMLAECKGAPASPEQVRWEPRFGGRASRARQLFYTDRGLSPRARAGMDLGFLFGISSNAIPAAGWMLTHILAPRPDDPSSLYADVMAEVHAAVRPGPDVGTTPRLDIPTLVASPLLQSILHEVLRLYVDTLVTRELHADITLPLENNQPPVLLRQGDVVMAPSWLGHRSPANWPHHHHPHSPGPDAAPADVFHPRRFLQPDPDSTTGAPFVFSTAGTAGRLFPFGGGRGVCPGRAFARQEILAAVALVLCSFEVEPVGFVDEGGRETGVFPGLKDVLPGSAVLGMRGDLRVRLRRRGKR